MPLPTSRTTAARTFEATKLIADDAERVRTLTLDRPQALNAFNEELYDDLTVALMSAAADPQVAVVVLTGSGRAFSAGQDVVELASRVSDPGGFKSGVHGFPGLLDQLARFPKPLICAVNGMALGVGVTLLCYADLVMMSTEARVRLPFTDLAVAPEAGSSVLLPMLVGRQEATWLLMSSEWLTAEECARMGLAWRLVGPERLQEETAVVARHLAAKPLASLIETKRTMNSAHQDVIAAARDRENRAFARLLGRPANLEALAALAERRAPDFIAVDTAHPVDVNEHTAD